MPAENFKDKKVIVVGLARSGVASAELLNNLGAKVFITELNKNSKLEDLASNLISKGISVELGWHSRDFIQGAVLMVVSPGVPNSSQALQLAKELKIPAISEIELGFRFCPAPIVAVTGTNGKTTVTTLCGEILRKKYKRVFVLGNIGTPFCSQVLQVSKDDFVVLEVSSFQLERTEKFKPKVAVVLNFTPDHLDHHSDLDEYLAAKRRIFLNQDKNDFAVLNADDKTVKDLAASTLAKVVYFGNANSVNINGKPANHNYLAVLAVSDCLNLDRNESLEILNNFKGVEHRLEFVRKIQGVNYINDSKATNIDSTLWAFDNIFDPIILIAGGRDKGSDFASIRHQIAKKVKLLVALGEAKDRIVTAFKDVVKVREAVDFKEAVKIAKENAAEGDCVVLSPMCKSFDMFDSYEHRGKVFKEIVNQL